MPVIHFVIEQLRNRARCRVESPPGTQCSESYFIAPSTTTIDSLKEEHHRLVTKIDNGEDVHDLAISLGQQLFKILMKNKLVEQLYREKLDQVISARQMGNNSATLSVWISCNSPEWQSLPWELVFDVKEKSFLSMWNYVCILRVPDHISHYQGIITPTISEYRPPLNILIVIASPASIYHLDRNGYNWFNPINTQKYVEYFEDIRNECGKDLVVCTSLVGSDATREKLEKEIAQGNHDVFYFVGHHRETTDEQTAIILEDGTEDRSGILMSAKELQELLKTSTVRIVVLTACNSFKTVTLLSKLPRLDAVIGMQMDMPMFTALEFDKAIISGLAASHSIHEYFIRGRIQIQEALRRRGDGTGDFPWRVTGWPYWAIPMIYAKNPNSQSSFCHIASGEFDIGLAENDLNLLDKQFSNIGGLPHYIKEYLNRFPHQKIRTAEFHIGRWPVTNHQYLFFLNNGPPDIERPPGFDKLADGRIHLNNLNPSAPVVGITFEEAELYCRWVGGRLPQAEEWEAAARCYEDGTRIFPWGDEFDPVLCSSIGSRTDGPESVFSRKDGKNFHAIEDLCGNVFEWTASSSPVFIGNDSYNWRLVVGGSWQSSPFLAIPAVRCPRDPEIRYRDVGFRCVL